MRPWLVALAAVLAASCTDPERERIRATSQGTYDPDIGRLTELTYDRNENGRVDTWVAMDGARPLAARIDADEDGVADRWEEYDDQGRLARAGESRASSGEPKGSESSEFSTSRDPSP